MTPDPDRSPAWPERDSPSERDFQDDALENLLGSYIDRLNAGEILDRRAIFKEQPELAEAILERLEVFQTAGADAVEEQPLGVLGDYKLLRQIGRGGMGVVYEAWQNSMDRRVALKVLSRAVAADTRAVERFLREAQIAGKLAHPNIVAVHGIGIEERVPWYAMEFVDGETLAQILTRLRAAGQAPTPEECYRTALNFAGVAEGLQHAHEHKIIHRDLKPSNLILARSVDDREGRLRILDFGIARMEGQESLTQSGDFLGTPLYMSPEQARRKKIPIDHRTDIYSLGATLYEILTLRPPFQDKDHQDTLSQIIERDPVEPRRLNPRLPRDLETIVLKCLRKDPAGRYSTAEALAQDLRRFARGDAIEARTQSAWERWARRLRRHAGILLVAAAFFLLLSSLAWFAHRARQADREAKLAAYRPAILEVLRKIQANEFSLGGLSGRAKAVLGHLGDGWFGSKTSEDLRNIFGVDALLRLDEAAAKLAAIAKALPEKPEAHYYLARTYLLLERKDLAREVVEQALKTAPGFVPARVLDLELRGQGADGGEFTAIWSPYEGRECWEKWWLLAYRGAQKMNWAEAAGAYGKLIALREEGEPFIGCMAEAHLGRGLAHLAMADFVAAVEDFSAARIQTSGLAPALLLAKAHWSAGGLEHKKRAEEIFNELHDTDGAQQKDEAALWIAVAHGSMLQWNRSVEWARKLKGFPFKDRIEAYCLWRAGRTEEAIAAGRRATSRDERDPVARLILASALLTDLMARTDLEEDRVSELLEIAKEAVRLDPQNRQARSLLEAAEDFQRQWYQERRLSMKSLKHTMLVPVAALFLQGAGWAGEGLVGGFFDDVRPVA